jgi:hypothetical protein
MIRHYTFNYNAYEAEACFKVDTEKFKAEDAKLLLEFFNCDYDKEADPIDELMKKYAIKAIRIATGENYDEEGVKSWFAEQEGFLAIDGSQGVELNLVSAYEFDEDALDMEVVTAWRIPFATDAPAAYSALKKTDAALRNFFLRKNI